MGDVFFQAKCYHKFEEFKEMGKTIVFVSHDLSSISKYCDRVVLLNKGVKLGEGSPKEMIDTYKRVLVGQYEIPDDAEHTNLLHDKDIREKVAGKAQEKKAEEENGAKQGINPELLEYGSKKARIEEYGLTDCNGVKTTAVIKGQEYTIRMKAVFTEDCPAPIFAFTIKNIKGTEITGTNTMVEKAFLEPVKAGEVKEITFTQHMNLQGGEYLLSLGVTGYEGDDFTVYHRLYDVLNMTVISDKDTVGFYDPESAVQVL